ncbi:50S ribosomal protein L24 [Alphaproteobacteria bacterium]|jgi:large subunit ribosomal protein L24|nr:50S ribosomal protein L24 [Alphaproteobacteria bacterium]
MKLKIKTGDDVVVTAGKDKGKRGKVTKVIRSSNRVIVQGANMVLKHQKPSQDSAGGIIPKEASLHISNVALVDPADGKATRVGYRFNDAGVKERFSKRSGAVIA